MAEAFTFDEESVRRIVRAVLAEERRNKSRQVRGKKNWQPIPISVGGGGTDANCNMEIGCGIVVTGAGPFFLNFDAEHVAGTGLQVEGDCQLGVDEGRGLQKSAGGQVEAKIQAGLAFDGSDSIAVQTGDGVAISALNRVEAKLARGLTFDPSRNIETLLGCGLFYDSAGAIAVSPSQLSGPGLKPVGSSTCQITINAGCGTELVSGQLRVKRGDLMGLGLEAGSSTCDMKIKLAPSSCLILDSTGLRVDSSCLVGDVITPGCGVEFSGGLLRVKASDLAGAGLTTESACAGAGTALTVNTGCGLTKNGDLVEVQASAIAGDGMAPDPLTSCGVKINVGCGTELVSGQLRVKRADLLGLGLEAGSSTCDLKIKLAPSSCLILDSTGLRVDSSCLVGDVITPGCGVEFSGGLLRVKASDLAGTGLGTETACSGTGTALTVNTGCGLVKVGDEVQVQAAALCGPGLVPATGCQITLNVGCGVALVSGQLRFNPADVIGNGLMTTGICGIQLNIGCGLEFNGAQVRIKSSDLAGPGLTTESACSGQGTRLKVLTGCGTTIIDGALWADANALAGPGLTPVGGSSCAIQVAVGCGLQNVSDQISVKRTDLMGKGLEPDTGTCNMRVKLGSCLVYDVNNAIAVDVACLGGQVVTAGCGINVVGGQVSFKPSDVAGLGLVPGATGCKIDVGVGCGLIRTANDISVDAAAIAGTGLVPAGSGCKVNINTQVAAEFTAHRITGCRFEVDTATNTLRFIQTVVPVITKRNAQLIPVVVTEGFPFDLPACTIPLSPC